MLAVTELVKQFGDLRAVDNVSFTANAGVVYGLLGPNGAGKSTLINCVSGLLSPTSGSASVNGYDVVSQAREARRSLGVVPQELAIYEDLPAVENLRFWGKAYGLSGAALSDRVSEVLNYIGLADRAGSLPKNFSGGMKRRLNFGCGIVHRPSVLLLDEPTVGVDPQSRKRLFEMVEQERSNGACILYTTHYMDEAERLCDSLAIVDHGKLIAEGTVEALRSQTGARDILQLSGRFPEAECRKAITDLAESGLDELAILSQDESGLSMSLTNGSQHLPAVFAALTGAGAEISETSLRSPNLETLFLLLTGKELRE